MIYNELKNFENDNFKMLFNLYLPTNNRYTEIDSIIILSKGIIVIESKNYKGMIYGNSENTYWEQIIGREKHSFYNPIKQNKNHILHLRRILNDNNIEIYNFIVFSNNANIKNIFNNKFATIINLNNLNNAVESIISNNNTLKLEECDIDKLYRKLFIYTQNNENIKKEHIKNLKKRRV